MCMGSTKTEIDNVLDTQNHPHVYGEYISNCAEEVEEGESPPCVWGVRYDRTNCRKCIGITPMCMGSTLQATCLIIFIKNHPHVYGEYPKNDQTNVTPQESPPCVWGVQ